MPLEHVASDLTSELTGIFTAYIDCSIWIAVILMG